MLHKVRVTFVLPSLKAGGSERQALLLARHLVHDLKAEVVVLGPGEAGWCNETCAELGIPVRAISMTWPADRAKRLKVLVRFASVLWQTRPQIILPYTVRPNVFCGLAWRLVGAKLCIWNQRDGGLDNKVSRRTQRWVAQWIPWYISNSQHGKEFLIRDIGVKADRIKVIYNGVDLSKPQKSSHEWRQNLGMNDKCFVACMVARLRSSKKDPETVLKAWRIVMDHLAEKGLTGILLMAGPLGEKEDTLRNLARELSLGHGVQFLGEVSDVSGLLNIVDAGILCSYSEGSPNGLLECMASSLPIVATDLPGIRDAVGECGEAFLVPPQNHELLAYNLIRLTEDPVLRSALGKLNSMRVKSKFSVQRMFRDTVSFIEENFKCV